MDRVLAVLAAVDYAGPQPLTASVGVVQYQPGESVDDAFARADAAMYASKRSGGGEVTADRVPDVPPTDPVWAVDGREGRDRRD